MMPGFGENTLILVALAVIIDACMPGQYVAATLASALSVASTPVTHGFGIAGGIAFAGVAIYGGYTVYEVAMDWGEAASVYEVAEEQLSATWTALTKETNYYEIH